MNRCPYCESQISETAKKCKYCGEWLSGDYQTQQNSLSQNVTGDSLSIIKNALAAKYEILGVIGKGGMASVYRARQINLNRIVALKIIHLNLIHDDEFLNRFKREAELGASLNHPNIVTTHDVGSIGDVHYMAMELLEGKNLHHIIKEKGKLSENETIQYIAPIAHAANYAHENGIIHRDIKSSNIIIVKGGIPKLTDFGIAHAAEGTKLTQAGAILGTPEYMSPEQAEGKTIDFKSDLYSLGIVMYECLTGFVPFNSENPLTTIHKIIYDTPPLVSNYNSVSNRTKNLLQSLLEKDKEKRPASGEEIYNYLIAEYQRDITTKLEKDAGIESPLTHTKRPKKIKIKERADNNRTVFNFLANSWTYIIMIVLVISFAFILVTKQDRIAGLDFKELLGNHNEDISPIQDSNEKSNDVNDYETDNTEEQSTVNDTKIESTEKQASNSISFSDPGIVDVNNGSIIVSGNTSKIESLDLSNRNIKDISQLSHLENLEVLHLYNNNISDISALSKLSLLKELTLGENRVSDISPISNLYSLTKLDLGGNPINSLYPIRGLENLGILAFSSEYISDLSPIAELRKLERLAFSCNSNTDISPLYKLSKLRKLYIGRKISNRELAELKSALPDCEIIVD